MHKSGYLGIITLNAIKKGKFITIVREIVVFQWKNNHQFDEYNAKEVGFNGNLSSKCTTRGEKVN